MAKSKNQVTLPNGQVIVADPYATKKQLKKIPIYLLIIFLILITSVPLLSTLGMSFKTNADMYSVSLFPSSPEGWTLDWYNSVLFGKAQFYIYFLNSFKVSVIVMALSTVVSIFAGYSLSRYRKVFKPLNWFVYLLLVLQMFPIVLMLIPLFIIFNSLNLNNTHEGLMIAYLTFSLPLNIWMIQGFFDSIPIDMEEAALIDGASKFQSLVKVVLPVSSPGVGSVAIFAFNYCWNEFVLASLFLKPKELRTLPIGLQMFVQENTKEWGLLTAASIVTIIPILIFFIFMQRYLVAGLTAGAVKG
ncbi:carbohydrate ABC transporter permease [Luoshenia tenuis]|jgi:ABC-type glycerol-3-phosphate transport system permease component|uniref:carbohydrate ABC transporter permease n=1 Tax=Luoshenia tenuis TaxID=2763654 RepID=UPI003D8D12D8